MTDVQGGHLVLMTNVQGGRLVLMQVNAAIEDVLLEAAADADEGLDFAAFKMLASVAYDGSSALDQYDARLAGSSDPGGSVRSQQEALMLLQPVPEADT